LFALGFRSFDYGYKVSCFVVFDHEATFMFLDVSADKSKWGRCLFQVLVVLDTSLIRVSTLDSEALSGVSLFEMDFPLWDARLESSSLSMMKLDLV
ncbi:hypothetical protein U1Q18_047327, partial [Sarracenia purpurea var. burkii]